MKSMDYLFVRPSFIRGVAKILDIGATSKVYSSSVHEAESDYKALLCDWNVIGNDMKGALNDYQKQYKQYKKELKAAGFK